MKRQLEEWARYQLWGDGPGGGVGGLLLYVSYMGMCHTLGYGFRALAMGYGFCLFSLEKGTMTDLWVQILGVRSEKGYEKSYILV